MQTDILLSTLNARYHHASFGLRYLYANLAELQSQAKIIEYVIQKDPTEIVNEILSHNPKIVGFGVYIWNVEKTEEVVEILKSKSPETVVVVGGPEVSYETETQKLYQICDYVIKGEADFLFKEFCTNILSNNRPIKKLISGPLPEISKIRLPYDLYSDHDIKFRTIYVEASRGCPYKCEYCLSSLDVSVRNIPIDSFLVEMDSLIQRGARQFKFVDRTFNLSPTISKKILQFFLDKIELGLFLHFEMVPDRLPVDLREMIEKFPKGSLQFEIGIQTWNPIVARNVSRRQDYEKIKENFKFLREKTGVHTHADLIVGLPGESLQSFADGFNALLQCDPDEIQVGILKRLKGTPIVRHDKEFQMVYSSKPPFQILQNKDMDPVMLEKFTHFSRFWDLIANSGNFLELIKVFKQKNQDMFQLFWNMTDFLLSRHGQSHGIALDKLFESVNLYLVEILQMENESLEKDYIRKNRKNLSKFIPKRQQKHFISTTNTP